MAAPSTEHILQQALDSLRTTAGGAQPKDLYKAQEWEMAGAHAMFLNGLLNIYQQATLIPDSKAADFAGHSLLWSAILHHHHEYEEETYYPMFGPKFELATVVAEHEAFLHGVNGLDEYFISCLPEGTPYAFGKISTTHKVARYDGTRVKAIIDGFAQPLADHLLQEIDMLEPQKLRASGLTESDMKIITATSQKMVQSMPPSTFLAYAVFFAPPWTEFPPAPWLLKKVVVPYFLAYFNRNYWQFCPAS